MGSCIYQLSTGPRASIPPAASPGVGRAAGAHQVSSCYPNGPTPASRQGDLCLGHFCPSSHHLSATTVSHCWPGRDAGCDLDDGLELEVSPDFPRYQWSALVIDG